MNWHKCLWKRNIRLAGSHPDRALGGNSPVLKSVLSLAEVEQLIEHPHPGGKFRRRKASFALRNSYYCDKVAELIGWAAIAVFFLPAGGSVRATHAANGLGCGRASAFALYSSCMCVYSWIWIQATHWERMPLLLLSLYSFKCIEFRTSSSFEDLITSSPVYQKTLVLSFTWLRPLLCWDKNTACCCNKIFVVNLLILMKVLDQKPLAVSQFKICELGSVRFEVVDVIALDVLWTWKQNIVFIQIRAADSTHIGRESGRRCNMPKQQQQWLFIALSRLDGTRVSSSQTKDEKMEKKRLVFAFFSRL